MKEHVALVIRDDCRKILFIKRSMKKSTLPGAWSFASGTVEFEEDFKNTVKREAKEELGIDVQVEGVIAIKQLPEFSVKLIFVLCFIVNGELMIKEFDEIEKFEWMRFSDFFKRFEDNEIGHGLIWLRNKPEIWMKYD